MVRVSKAPIKKDKRKQSAQKYGIIKRNKDRRQTNELRGKPITAVEHGR